MPLYGCAIREKDKHKQNILKLTETGYLKKIMEDANIPTNLLM